MENKEKQEKVVVNNLLGITEETQTVGRKYIKPTEENPITLTYVKEARVVTTVVEKEDSDYYGKEFPRLEIEFVQVVNKGEEAPVYIENIMPISLNIQTEKGLAVMHQKMFSKIKHFIEVLKGGNLDSKEIGKLRLYTIKGVEKCLNYTEIVNEYQNNIDKYLEDYKNFFTNAAEIINKYKDNKYVWLKLVFNKQRKYFTTPDFVQDGIIELFKKGVKTTLKIHVAKGETIKEQFVQNTNSLSATPPSSTDIPIWAQE